MQISQLQEVTKVVVHANCPDGTASAIILRDALNLKPEQIFFAQHDSIEYKEMKAEPGLLFCDCTPPQDRTQEFVAVGTIVLDHHKYSRDTVAAYGLNGAFACKETDPEVSGAWLAYREVWKPINDYKIKVGVLANPQEIVSFVKHFAVVAGIRDNWQLQDEYWKESCEQAALLMFFNREFWMSHELSWLAENWDEKLGWLGPVLISNDEDRSKSIAEKRWTYRTESGLVIAIVPNRFISDVSDLLEDECSVVIGFSYTKNDPGCFPGLLLSLRSFGDSFDCGKFCKANGGGGHTNAAGCKFETTETTLNPYKFLCNKFDEYLSTININSEGQ